MFTEPTVCNCRWLPHRHRRGQYGCYWYRNAAGGPPAPRPLQSRAFWRALPAPDAGTPVAAAHRAAAALRPGMCVPPPDQEPPAGGWEPSPPRGRFAALLACLRHVLMYPMGVVV